MVSMYRKFRGKLETYPCFILLLGILNGFSAVYFFGKTLTCGTIFLTAVPGILIAWCILGLRNSCYRFIPATLLAVFSSFLIMQGSQNRFEKEEMGGFDRLGATAVFRLTDSSLCGGVPEWTPNAPYFIQAELQGFSLDDPAKMIPANEKILLTVSSSASDLKRIGYGDLVQVKGAFEKIPEPLFRGSFDFPSYAAARGSSLLFHADSLTIQKKGSGFLRSLYDWRSNFLFKLTSRMDRGTARDMAPALLFGIRQSVKGVIKKDFLYSGTLHVLSVSGFHIGLFFAAMMFFLSVLPYRSRWLAAPVPVFFYALSTGMQAPAFRAFLMLTMWCFSHVFLRNSKGLNTLSAAAAMILLMNPFQLFDIGFLYSFLCVFFLLICNDFFGEVTAAISVREQFCCDRKLFSWSRISGRLVSAIGFSLAAWGCSLAVSLSCQSLFTPWAVPAYLLMVPATWYCFALFLPAVILQWIPGVVEWLGVALALPLEICAATAEKFAESGASYIIPPPFWLCGIFLLSFAGLFLVRKRWKIFVCAGIVCFSGILLFFPFPSSDPEITVLKSHADSIPSVLFCDPSKGRAVVWNLPPNGTGEMVSEYLKTHGINGIEEVHFDSARKDICGGWTYLFSVFPPSAVYFHGEIRKNAKTARDLLRKYPAPFSLPLVKSVRDGDCVEMFPVFAGINGVRVRMILLENKGVVLETEYSGEILRKEYPFSSGMIAERIRLSPQKKAAWRSLLSR